LGETPPSGYLSEEIFSLQDICPEAVRIPLQVMYISTTVTGTAGEASAVFLTQTFLASSLAFLFPKPDPYNAPYEAKKVIFLEKNVQEI
jgi:hypothetical protein